MFRATATMNTTKYAVSLLDVLVLLSAIRIILASTTPTNNDFDSDATNQYDAVWRRLRSTLLPAASVATSDTPNVHPPSAYSHLIIQYHKTGHALAYSLTNRIKEDEDTVFAKVQHDPLLKRDHDKKTKCPHMNLKPGMVYVQAGPDFFCDIDILAEELLQGGEKKRGIKIIHLVRNPFDMAVSNYKYHAQDPTPERWVKGLDVCSAQENPYYPELFIRTLGSSGIMKYQDFGSILQLCHSLFQTEPGSEKKGYYSHLRHLDPVKGLLLATTHQMRGQDGDIARMANNIIKLRQLQQLEAQANVAQHHLVPEKRIQVLTLAMEEFNLKPKETAMRFLDFLVSDTSPPEVIERIASKYEQSYLYMLNAGNHIHITTGSEDNAMLEASLREHELFGGILGNIERLVNQSLG